MGRRPTERLGDMSEATSLLICALGGDGGGVLADWITRAGVTAGIEVSRTSVPGVAQRTGATAYYLEFASPGRPCLKLHAAPGRVDVVVATELVELARAMSRHFVSPQRTHVIASTHRAYTISERMAPGDGRVEGEGIVVAAQRLSKSCRLIDAQSLAHASGSRVNAVLLGALAAAGVLPVPASAFERVLRSDGDDANLRGFHAGLAPPQAVERGSDRSSRALSDERWRQALDRLPPLAQEVARHGAERLTDYQGARAATLYLDRLTTFAPYAGDHGELAAEVGRQLALLSTPDDVIRVAQLKTHPDRFRRIRAEAGVRPDQPARIVDYLKPGAAELAGLAPAPLGRLLLGLLGERTRRSGLALRVEVTAPWGYLLMKGLSMLRPLRPLSLLYRERQALIVRWLELVRDAAQRSQPLALEVARSAELLKGYATTLDRTQDAFERVLREICMPLLTGKIELSHGVDALIQARHAGAKDDGGTALQALIAALPRTPVADRG